MNVSKVRRTILCGAAAVSLFAGTATPTLQPAYAQAPTEGEQVSSLEGVQEPPAPQEEQSLIDKIAQYISEEVAEVTEYHDGTPTPETPLVYVFPDIHATRVHYSHTLSIDKLQRDLGLRLIGVEGDTSTRITSFALPGKLAGVRRIQANGGVYQLRRNEELATGRKSRPIENLEDLVEAAPLLKYTQQEDAELFGLEDPGTSDRIDLIEKIGKAYTLYFEAMHPRKKSATASIKEAMERGEDLLENELPPILDPADIERFKVIFNQLLSELPTQDLPPLNPDIARCYVSSEEWKILQNYEKDLKDNNVSPSSIREYLIQAFGDKPYRLYLRLPNEAPRDHRLPEVDQGLTEALTVHSTPFYRAITSLKNRYVSDIRTVNAVALAIGKTQSTGKRQVAIVYGQGHQNHIQYELEIRGCPYIVMGKPRSGK